MSKTFIKWRLYLAYMFSYGMRIARWPAHKRRANLPVAP